MTTGFLALLKRLLIIFCLLTAALVAIDWPLFSSRFLSSGQKREASQAISERDVMTQTLSIPALGILAPVIYPESSDEKKIQAALENGIAHYHGTALPGETGNAYFAGHSSDYIWSRGAYKTVFANLPEIKNGDEVIVSEAGREFCYIVTETRIVAADDLSALSQDTDGRRLLTLQTSYPVGTAHKRFLVIAEMR